MTIAQIKTANDSTVTNKSTIHSISPANVGGQLNALADALELPIHVDATDRQVTNDNTERDVWTFDVPANALVTNGDEMEVRLIYQTPHSASAVIRLYLRGTEILEQDTSGDDGVVDNAYTEITLRIYRLDANTLRYTIFWANDTTNTSVGATGFTGDKQASVDFTAVIPLRLSFQDISIGIHQLLNFTRVTFHRAA